MTAPAPASQAPAAPMMARGAEAVLEPSRFLDRPTLAKRRLPKAYRDERLDARLRTERTRDEASLLAAARRAGVRVPALLDVDRRTGTLHLEAVEARTLRQVLADGDAQAASRLEALGRAVARLHDAGLAHGDLTTSNVLVPDVGRPDALVLLDFGLGSFSEETEDRGVDLHLLEEALEATHADADGLFAAFLRGYAGARQAEATRRRLDEIRARGRYR